MRIALAQYNYHIGNFDFNTQKIIEGIKDAREKGADLVVFAELSVCGYPSGDFLEFNDYIEKCYKAIDEIASHCMGIAAIVGAPHRNSNPKGKPLYNAAFFLQEGQIRQIYLKGLLPNYDIFDEYRYFESATEFKSLEFKGKRIALTICEDLWNLYDNPLYTINPMDELAKEGIDFMINIAASPFAWDHGGERKNMLSQNTRRYKIPMFYVNQVGTQTELIFDGGSMVINQHGEIVHEMKSFSEDFSIISLEEAFTKRGDIPSSEIDSDRKATNIYSALVLGIQDYFRKMGFEKAILGLSGGIDSAVTMVIAADALGAENVTGVLLPGPFSSDHSVKDAEDLAKNLGSPYHTINISDTNLAFEKNLKPFFQDLPFDITEENIQSRTRAIYLMALSNKFGYILLNTSNKSEAAVGYGTLYGDMCGGLSVLGDVYKTEVFELAKYINKNKEVIPANTIVKPPSAELRPDQKDSDSLPEYDILDRVLFQYIECRKGPDELIKMGFEKSLIDRILKLVNTSEYKRYQTPPILRVSSKAFGMGRKMPIAAKYLG
ncbi:MAG: NAD+ synthase [Bacteroidetes bacterium]|nr:MAG: NAD+ synthase [Bacteroidota bacterium]